MKAELAKASLLKEFRSNCRTYLTTDAGGHSLGAVLSQRQDGKDIVIAYASRALTGSEQRYSTNRTGGALLFLGSQTVQVFLMGFTICNKDGSQASVACLGRKRFILHFAENR